MPNRKLIEFLLSHNKKQSALFTSPDETLSRRQYRSKHPTAISAMKCMDGRLNLSIITKTPPGIIQPFRNIGGMFDLGWPYFGQLLGEWVRNSTNNGSDCLILVTYHWSKGNRLRGCKGFNYDMKVSYDYTKDLKHQVERVFGKGHHTVYPIQVGIETDDDALILHGEKGGLIDLSRELDTNKEELSLKLRKLYPDMKQQIIEDFLPLLLGNIAHIEEIKKLKRPVAAVEHGEQILAVGRGFDWLHIPNKALIIGPYSYNLGEPIITAAQLLVHNLKSKRIPQKNGAVLMSSATYRDEAGPERFQAIEKTRSIANFALATIKANVPELLPHIQPLIGIVSVNTRLFTQVPLKK